MSRKLSVPFKVYAFLLQFKEQHDGNSPTYQEISQHFGWSSATTAWVHVDKLTRTNPPLVAIDTRKRITLLGGSYSVPASSKESVNV